MAKTFKIKIDRVEEVCFIPVPFDPKTAFGKARAPVRVTLNRYMFRSTIFAMCGPPFIPLRKSNRDAAHLENGGTVQVRIELDTEKREVKPPADLVKALKAAPPAWDRWKELSFTHQREHAEAIEQARKPETRARRLAAAVRMVRARPAKTPR